VFDVHHAQELITRLVELVLSYTLSVQKSFDFHDHSVGCRLRHVLDDAFFVDHRSSSVMVKAKSPD
jgi:hypothetical protein